MQKQQESAMNNPKSFNLLGPCAIVFSSSNTGSWRTERPVVDYSKCVKCGACEMYCPANVISLDKQAESSITFMWDYCKGCGICANECPQKCISMVSERNVK